MSHEFTDHSGRAWRANNGELALDITTGNATVEDLEKAAAEEIVALAEKCSRLERGQAIVDRANYRKALTIIANSDSRDPQLLIDIARGALMDQVFQSYCSFRVETLQPTSAASDVVSAKEWNIELDKLASAYEIVGPARPSNRHPIAKVDWRAVPRRRS